MNNNLRSLAIMTITAIIGLTIVVVVALVTRFYLSHFVATFFPSAPQPPNQGLGVIRLPSNFGIYLTLFALSNLLNGGIGSFISGVLLQHWGRGIHTRAWQSFIIGLIIGFVSSNLAEVLRNRPIQIFVPLIYGLATALIGLLGYYLASRVYRRPKVAE